jgi:hypothetical protein
MNARVQTLKADILADTGAIAEIYSALHRYAGISLSEEQLIVVAYYLHNLYSSFESIFQRVAEVFENHVPEQAGWHAGLLHRMTLTIEGIRPAVVANRDPQGKTTDAEGPPRIRPIADPSGPLLWHLARFTPQP